MLEVIRVTDKPIVAYINWATKKAGDAKIAISNNPTINLADLYHRIMQTTKSDLLYGTGELMPDKITLTYKGVVWYEITDDGRKLFKL